MRERRIKIPLNDFKIQPKMELLETVDNELLLPDIYIESSLYLLCLFLVQPLHPRLSKSIDFHREEDPLEIRKRKIYIKRHRFVYKTINFSFS